MTAVLNETETDICNDCRAAETSVCEGCGCQLSAEWDAAAVRLRLQASKQKDDFDCEQFGRRMGRRWATEEASYRELLGLAQYAGLEQANRIWVQAAQQERVETNADIDAHWIGDIIVWANEIGSCEGIEFWEEILDGDAQNVIDYPASLQGFVAGALEVWTDVKDQL